MKPHHRIYGIFFIFAISMGSLLARLPDIQLKYGLSQGELGLTLISASVGALIGLTFSGPLVERFGARTTAFVTVFAASALYALIPWVPSGIFIVPVLFLSGLAAGAIEINVNLQTDRHEAVLGYRIMSRAHGMWSLGFFVAALLASGIRQLGISPEIHTFGALVFVLVAGGIVFAGIEDAPHRPDAHAGDVPRVAFPTWGLLPLCLIGAAPLFVEGAGVDWSGIYMRDVFAVEPWIGTMAVTLFSFFMAMARLFMDKLVDRSSPRLVAGGLLGIAGIGLLTVSFAPDPTVALIGFTLMGIGCSSVYPLAVSAAAQRTDRPAAVNVAALGQMTFVVFFLGPPILGFVAEFIGIRASYLVVLPLVAGALMVIRALAARPVAMVDEPEPLTPHG